MASIIILIPKVLIMNFIDLSHLHMCFSEEQLTGGAEEGNRAKPCGLGAAAGVCVLVLTLGKMCINVKGRVKGARWMRIGWRTAENGGDWGRDGVGS